MYKNIKLFIGKQKTLICLFIVYSIANSLFITLVSFLAKEIVNSIVVPNNSLLRDSILYSLAGMLLIVIAYITKLSYTNKSCKIVSNLQKDIFTWIKNVDTSSVQKLDSGEIIMSITRDAKKIYTFLSEDLSGVIESVLIFIVMSATCIYFNKVLFLFTLVCSIVNGVAIFLVKKIEKSERVIRESEKNVKNLNLQIFRALPIINLFSGTKTLLEKCEKDIRIVSVEENKKVKLESMYALLSWGSNMIREVGIIVIAPLILKLDLGSTMAIINVSSYLNSTLATIGECILNIQQVAISFEHIDLLKKLPAENNEETSIKDPHEIFFQNISYSYDKQNIALKEVSLKMAVGTYIAVMGEIGGGKTTLLKIILGFLFPDQGVVTVDGEPLKESTMYKLREYVSYVDQESSMVEGTILENLCGFKEGRYSQEQINEVLERVKLKEWVESLEDGLNTDIGQKGHKISGGERQRLAIARALLKDSKFLIIDEPTSALDEENEKMIQAIIETERAKRGIIVVTHNEKLVENADYALNLSHI